MTLVSRTASAPRAQAVGQAMVLMSATAVGALAIFAKLGYANGLGTQQLLAVRFVLAALGMAAMAFLLGQNILRLRRKDVAILLAMGGLLYTVQSLTYFWRCAPFPPPPSFSSRTSIRAWLWSPAGFSSTAPSPPCTLLPLWPASQVLRC